MTVTIWNAIDTARVELAILAEKYRGINYRTYGHAEEAEVAEIALDATTAARAIAGELMVKLADILADWSEADPLTGHYRDDVRICGATLDEFIDECRVAIDEKHEMAREAAE